MVTASRSSPSWAGVPRIQSAFFAVLADSPNRSTRRPSAPLALGAAGACAPDRTAGTMPQPSEAARGGRIGGGSFRAPSMPRSSGYRGGGMGGGYNRGYGGGGFGFPFIIPIFGFGGGGLLGFLVLMGIVGVLVNAVRGLDPAVAPPSADTTARAKSPVARSRCCNSKSDCSPAQSHCKAICVNSPPLPTPVPHLVCNEFCRKQPWPFSANPSSGFTPTWNQAVFRSTLRNPPSIVSR